MTQRIHPNDHTRFLHDGVATDARNPLQRGAGVRGKAEPIEQEQPYSYQSYWVRDCKGHLAIVTSPSYSSTLEAQSWGYGGA